ncbi:MAG: hypothetical protein VX899_24475 [Myxococcota bacterium]|nr:hypothetical protein [Myxococcota bacterium]
MFDWFKKKTPPPRGTPDQLIPLIKRAESDDAQGRTTIVMEGDQAPVLERLLRSGVP